LGLPISAGIPAGMWIIIDLSRGPASISRTSMFGSADRRFASTQPALPAPMIT
jgi:hypothetical protein